MTWLIENWTYGLLPTATLGLAVVLGYRAAHVQRKARR